VLGQQVQRLTVSEEESKRHGYYNLGLSLRVLPVRTSIVRGDAREPENISYPFTPPH